ncbi:MAG: hypothetical protein ACC700_16255, partial [Anaerolineales bacterium]
MQIPARWVVELTCETNFYPAPQRSSRYAKKIKAPDCAENHPPTRYHLLRNLSLKGATSASIASQCIRSKGDEPLTKREEFFDGIKTTVPILVGVF